ncbi:MAG: outer membrane protein assembly factor BamC [Thioalkalivibrionaceae bacterium]
MNRKLVANRRSSSTLSMLVTPVAVMTLAIALSGCSSSGPVQGPVYQGAEVRDNLEIPPNLLANVDPAFQVRESGERISARAIGDTNAQASPARGGAGRVTVLPTSDEVRIERDAQTRWLVVDQPPEALWELLRAFWRAERLPLETDDPRNGVMVTQWAENRAGIPLSRSQSLLARALGTLYDADTRDQYRMRVERNESGGTNIYVAHRGAEQRQQGGAEFRWVMREPDPELEAVMLNRLAGYLITGEVSDSFRAAALDEDFETSGEVDLVEREGRLVLVLRGNPDNLWRRLGLALDRVGLVVDAQDRRAGFYEVTYRPDIVNTERPGFFGRLLGRGERADRRANERYRVVFDAEGTDLLVSAQAIDGGAIDERDARFVLERLQPELR